MVPRIDLSSGRRRQRACHRRRGDGRDGRVDSGGDRGRHDVAGHGVVERVAEPLRRRGLDRLDVRGQPLAQQAIDHDHRHPQHRRQPIGVGVVLHAHRVERSVVGQERDVVRRQGRRHGAVQLGSERLLDLLELRKAEEGGAPNHHVDLRLLGCAEQDRRLADDVFLRVVGPHQQIGRAAALVRQLRHRIENQVMPLRVGGRLPELRLVAEHLVERLHSHPRHRTAAGLQHHPRDRGAARWRANPGHGRGDHQRDLTIRVARL